MELNINEIVEQLRLQEQYHQTMANSYKEVILDLQKIPSIQVETQKAPVGGSQKGRIITPEHRARISEGHRRRNELLAQQKQQEKERAEKDRINNEQIKLLQRK